MSQYSTNQLSEITLAEIKEALHQLEYGSVEIFVQNGLITQITKRIIKKTKAPNHIGSGQAPNGKAGA